MADRKQFLADSTPDPELMRLLSETRSKTVSEDDLREQRVSFAFGNALNIESVTKDSVRHSSLHISLRNQD